MKLPIKNVLVLKKKGQNTTKKSQSCAKIVNPCLAKKIVFSLPTSLKSFGFLVRLLGRT
jgi:hypothetical protein